MTVTLPLLADRFNRFNAQIFGNKLPPLPLKVSSAATRAGCYSHRTVRRGLSTLHHRSITISKSFDLDPDAIDDVIIHEMIHYWIDLYGPHGQSPHGPAFRTMMAQINHTYSRHISVTIAAKSQSRRPFHIICTAILTDGRIGLMVTARSRIFQMYRAIPRLFSVKECHWYLSHDRFFDRFPAALKPKLYLPDPIELNHVLIAATPRSIDIKNNKITTLSPPSTKKHSPKEY